MAINSEQIISSLQLQPHVEGGHYKETYVSPHVVRISGRDGLEAERKTLTCIFYMLSVNNPIGCTHKNRSDIVRYYQLGLPLRFILLFPDGTLEEVVLGPDLTAGQKLQLVVPGGTWLSTELVLESVPGCSSCDFGLVSEAVSPGFHWNDWCIATKEDIKNCFPQHWGRLKPFIKSLWQ